MALTPKVRMSVEMSLDTNKVISSIASEQHLSKSGVVRQAVYVMKTLIDAKNGGANLVIVSANGEQKQFVGI